MRTAITAALVAALTVTSAWADGDDDEEPHADIFIGRPVSGAQTLIGGALVPDDLNLEERVFEGDLGEAGDTYFGTEPGFFNPGTDNLEGAMLPAGAAELVPGESITVNQVGDLLYWDGVFPIDFVATPAELILTPVGDTASATGSIDDHPLFTIDDLGSGDLPAGGIYLATLTAELDGLSASDEVEVLFVTNESFEEAVEAAERFLNGVPEPTTLGLLLIAGLGFLPTRRG